MLSVTGLNHFYYVRDFTDMRCKHSRVLSIIREQLHREPNDGDVFIVMSKSTFAPVNKVYKNNGFAAYHSPKEGIAGAGNVLAPANKL